MQERQEIHNYLKSLAKYLSRLDQQEADEVLREIESHIYDVIDMQEEKGQLVNVAEILRGFGPPRQLAEHYVAHIVDGTPLPPGFSAMDIVKRGASKSLYWGSAILGYSVGVSLIFLAFAKLMVPNLVGIWSSANGNSLIVGMVEHPYQYGNELAGMWLVPAALVLGFLTLRLTYGVLHVLKNSMQRK